MLDLSRARDRMVDVQIARRGVRDPHVLDAMRQVPREAFVEPGLRGVRLRGRAAADRRGPDDLPALHRRADDRGRRGEAGRSRARSRRRLGLCRRRDEPDRRAGLRHRAPPVAGRGGAASGSQRLGYDNIELRVGDGTLGWPEAAPFDAILVAAGGPEVPQALKEQLAVGGRLVIPVGEEERHQTLLKVTRTGETAVRGGGSRRRHVRAADRRAGLGRGRPARGHQPRARPVARADACRR